MIERTLRQVLATRIDFKKAIIIFGPRQTGKTTLAKALATQLQQPFVYFNGDASVTKTLWKTENIAALTQSFGTKKIVILDEAQMIDQVGLICKQLIDAELGIQLIITGSSSLTIADKTQEPLTGRKWEHYLYPISCAELMTHQGIPTFLETLSQYLVYGMYPEVVTHLQDAKAVLTNIASSYLYKDVLALVGLKKPQLLEKILKALALQVGNEVSLNELATLVSADVKTVDNYIYLLEQVFVVYRLGSISRSERNEISTKKKIYFYDNGIRNALLGNFAPVPLRQDIGALWENFLIAERKKMLAYHGFYGRSYFWRNKQQAEIDYVEEIDGKIYAYELKCNPTAKSKFSSSFTNAFNPVETKVIHPENFWQWLNTYPY
ncbi:MAG: ATP-binding protein [Bacteroidetes bacterium]|nr:MAG: ATP-binding protein [Bacteroidota bacterium]